MHKEREIKETNGRDIIYIYKRLRPNKKIRNRKKERAAKTICFNEIEHQTS